MNRKTAARLLEENMHTIYAWSLSKLYDKSEAEDLSQDIICAVLKSVHRLENDEAFFGFMWRIADNTFKCRIRKKTFQHCEYSDENVGVYWNTPEDEVVKSEEVMLLRRELSLLTKQYRDVTVAYYIYGKSCSDISKSLGISREMVKYYLFRARKIVKEGIGMAREFGEKSYNPGVFRMDFWGGCSDGYWELFHRKLPGNIVLAAYERPVTVSELSVELGVASVYLEDELAILEEYEIVKKKGGKYQTNIVIFTEAYEKRLLELIKLYYTDVTGQVNQGIQDIMPELEQFNVFGQDYDYNRKKWTYTNLIMHQAWRKTDEIMREKFGQYPALVNGSFGFVFGYDNDYEMHHFNGIYESCTNDDNTACVSIFNYKIIEKCQRLQMQNWTKTVQVMNDAVVGKTADGESENLIRLIENGVVRSDHGILVPAFPVFAKSVLDDKILKLLMPVIDKVSEAMLYICGMAEKTLADYVPDGLKDKCGQLAVIHHQMDVMAFLVETMVRNGHLSIPKERMNLCIYGVDLTR